MKKQLSIILAFLIISVIVIANIAIAATGKVNDNNIRMRKEPNTTSEIITNLYKNDSVEVLEKTGNWYKIKYDGKIGYMRADLIDITSGTVTDAAAAQTKPETTTQQQTTTQTPETTQTVEKKEYVLKEDGNIKTYPVMYARNKLTVKKGEKVEKTEELGKWIKVKKDNTIGWILSTEVE